MLISENISIVGKDAVVSCAGNRNGEGAVHVIRKLQLKGKANWLAKLPY